MKIWKQAITWYNTDYLRYFQKLFLNVTSLNSKAWVYPSFVMWCCNILENVFLGIADAHDCYLNFVTPSREEFSLSFCRVGLLKTGEKTYCLYSKLKSILKKDQRWTYYFKVICDNIWHVIVAFIGLERFKSSSVHFWEFLTYLLNTTSQKMKFSIKNFFSKCDQISRKNCLFSTWKDSWLRFSSFNKPKAEMYLKPCQPTIMELSSASN